MDGSEDLSLGHSKQWEPRYKGGRQGVGRDQIVKSLVCQTKGSRRPLWGFYKRGQIEIHSAAGQEAEKP